MLVIKIETIDNEGRGRANCDGWDYAVRGAFPGDEVEAKVERVFKARRLYVCRVKHFLKTGPYHIHRSCKHKRPCPACPLHGVQESYALDLKRRRIVDALKHQGFEFPVDPVTVHEDLEGYRQKVKLMVDGKPGELKLGVYIPYSHTFSEASACPHVNPAINQAIADLMPVLNKYIVEPENLTLNPSPTTGDGPQKSPLKAVILRAGREGVAGILVTSEPLPRQVFEESPLFSLTERIQSENTNSILGGIVGRHVGPHLISSLEDGQPVDPDSFCQTDPKQAVHMYDLVADYVWSGQGKYIDAYAGVGGFSKALLRKGECDVTAIESNPHWGEGKSVAEVLPSLAGEKIKGLIVDPPKKGLMQDAEPLAGLGAEKVALVSCDPDAMARDLKVFVNQGYQVSRIIPIDFFGATPAIETVVLMYKP
jgi:23S rRNA (uracil1939-C5)-methyltransferase